MSYNHIGSIIKNLIESLSDTSSAYGEVFEEVDNRMTVPGSAKYTLSLSYNVMGVRPTVYIDGEQQDPNDSYQVPISATVRLALNGSVQVGILEVCDYSGLVIDGVQSTDSQEFYYIPEEHGTEYVSIVDGYSFIMPRHNVEVLTTWTVGGCMVRIHLPLSPDDPSHSEICPGAKVTIDGRDLVPDTPGGMYETIKLRGSVSLKCDLSEVTLTESVYLQRWTDNRIQSADNPFIYTGAYAYQTLGETGDLRVSPIVDHPYTPEKFQVTVEDSPEGSIIDMSLNEDGGWTPVVLPFVKSYEPDVDLQFSLEDIISQSDFGGWFRLNNGVWEKYPDDEHYQDLTVDFSVGNQNDRIRAVYSPAPPVETMKLDLASGSDLYFRSIKAYLVSDSNTTFLYNWGTELTKDRTYHFHIEIDPCALVFIYYVVGDSIQTLQPSNPLSFDFYLAESATLDWVGVSSSSSVLVKVPNTGTVKYLDSDGIDIGVTIPVVSEQRVGYDPSAGYRIEFICDPPLVQGKVFDHWYDINGSEETELSDALTYTQNEEGETYNTRVEARYKTPTVDKYILSKAQIVGGNITVSVGGQVQALPCMVDDGSIVTLANTPAEGYTFSHYIVNDATIEGNTFTISGANAVVGAVFNQQATFTGFINQEGAILNDGDILNIPEHNSQVPVWVNTNSSDLTYWITGDTSSFSVTRPMDDNFLIVRDIDWQNDNYPNSAVLHVQVGDIEKTLNLTKVVELQGQEYTYTPNGSTNYVYYVNSAHQYPSFHLCRAEMWIGPAEGTDLTLYSGPRVPYSDDSDIGYCVSNTAHDVYSFPFTVSQGDCGRLVASAVGHQDHPYVSAPGTITLTRNFLDYDVAIEVPANTSGAPRYYVVKFKYIVSRPLFIVIYQSA